MVRYSAASMSTIATNHKLFEMVHASPATASIAVLPLANESGEANQQYFSDGTSEDPITALSQFQGLKVIGRTSAFQFRDSKEDGRSTTTGPTRNSLRCRMRSPVRWQWLGRAKLLPVEHAAVLSDQPPSGSLQAYNAPVQGRFFFSASRNPILARRSSPTPRQRCSIRTTRSLWRRTTAMRNSSSRSSSQPSLS